MQTKDSPFDMDTEPSSKLNDIVLLVENPHVPVRVQNAIQRAARDDKLPIRTVREYMSDPQGSFRKFLKLPNIGRKSVGLLHELILDADERLKATGTTKTQEGSANQSIPNRDAAAIDEKLKSLCKAILAQLTFPHALFDVGTSTRLHRLLQNNEQMYRTFSDFIEDWHRAKSKFLQLENCGQTTIAELEERSYRIISERLDELGISDEYAQTIFSILCSNTVSDIDKTHLFDIIAHRLKVARRATTSSDEKQHSLSDYVRNALSRLPERERDILMRRYGISHADSETLEQIAATYGVTRERIRQIEAVAKRKLKLSKLDFQQGLKAHIREERILDKVFGDRRILLPSQAKAAFHRLSSIEQFSIRLAFGGFEKFLRHEAIQTDTGWVLDESFAHQDVEVDDSANTLRSRIVHVLQQYHLPIYFSELVTKIPEYSSEEIRHEMEERFGATFANDILQTAPHLPAATRYILILRKAGHSLHCRQIRSENYRIFGRDESISYIGNVLAKRREILIVARGTYDLYENLSLSEDDIGNIRDRVHDYLANKGQYISTKVLYADLFKGDSKRFGPAFDHTMLLGILQDDGRFDTRRGLMVGLSSSGSKQTFVSLQDEVWDFVHKATSPVTKRDVLAHLADTRDVFEASVVGALEGNPDIMSLGSGRYDLIARVIGSKDEQQELCLTCALALQEGPKSVLALSEMIGDTWAHLDVPTLRSFLGKQRYFEVTDIGVKLVATPDAVTRYLQTVTEIQADHPDSLNDLAMLGTQLSDRGAPNLTHLDPRLAIGRHTQPNADDPDSILKQLLADFEL